MDPKPKPRIYTQSEIQRVYERHHYHCGTVLYSTDGGWTWKSVPMDSGKWGEITDDRQQSWVYSFIEIPKKTEREKRLETALKMVKKHFPIEVISDQCGEDAQKIIDTL